MQTILVINDSSSLRKFLENQLSEYGFHVLLAINGIDGWTKIRHSYPDLILMDFDLTRKSSIEILKDVRADSSLSRIPIIMTMAQPKKEKLIKLFRLGVKKIFSTPIKIDILLKSLSEFLHVDIEIDETPCLLDVHMNDEILFIEIAEGFNHEKINLLHYKITELLRLYKKEDIRILLLITNMDFEATDHLKFDLFLSLVLGFTQDISQVHILTKVRGIAHYLFQHPSFYGLTTSDSFEKIIDSFFGKKGMESLTAEQDNIGEHYFSAKQELSEEIFQLNFKNDHKESRF